MKGNIWKERAENELDRSLGPVCAKPSVLDLYSGTGQMSQGFLELGWAVTRLEADPQFANVPHTTIGDVLRFKPKKHYCVVVGGPPCTAFTMAASGNGRVRWHHANGVGPYPFFGPRLPIDVESLVGCALVLQARRIIDRVKPHYFFLENPQGGLQTMGFMDDLPRVTVTYCQYGERRMKPTTIFGRFPQGWKPKRKCKNGDPCHVPGPRGSKTPGSTQGIKGSKDRAAVPISLAREIAEACL